MSGPSRAIVTRSKKDRYEKENDSESDSPPKQKGKSGKAKVQDQQDEIDGSKQVSPPKQQNKKGKSGKAKVQDEQDEIEKVIEKDEQDEIEKLEIEKKTEIERILKGAEVEYERILKVKKDATAKEKKKALFEKAVLVHPDHNLKNKAQANRAMQWLRTAFEKLKDPETSMPDSDDWADWAGWNANAFEGDDTDDNDDDEVVEEGEYEDPLDEKYKTADFMKLNSKKEKEKHEKVKLQRILDELAKEKTERAKAKVAIEREAPEPINRIYKEITPDVLQLLKTPEDESALQRVKEADERIRQYYADLENPVKEQHCTLTPSFLHNIAMRSRDSLKNLLENPDDAAAMQQYDTHALSLENQAKHFGWPKNWSLGLDENFSIVSLKDHYIKALQRDPDNKNTILGLQNINRVKAAISVALKMEASDGWAMEIDIPLIPIEELRTSYKQSSSPPFRENLRKAQTLKDEQERLLTYGNSGSTTGDEKPTSMTGDQKPIPTTRDDEPICGHRKWKLGANGPDAYLLAVLPNDKIPIGELRSGSLLGKDSRDTYLRSGATNQVRKCRGVDKLRWQGVERVFVHPSKKAKSPETWVQPLLADKSDTGELENIESPIMTRTEYCKLREGIDGDYDISLHYKKYQQTLPAHIARKLPQQASRTNQSQPCRLETAEDVQSRLKEEDSDAAALYEFLGNLRLGTQQGLNKSQRDLLALLLKT